MAEQKTVNSWKDVQARIAPEPAFPDAEFVQDNNTLVGQSLVFKDAVEREGKDGIYVIGLADFQGKEIAFSVGGVLADQLIKAKSADVMPFKATWAARKSAQSGRMYWTLDE